MLWQGAYSTRTRRALGSKPGIGEEPGRNTKIWSRARSGLYWRASPNGSLQPRVKNPLSNTSLGQQLALAAAAMCLLVSLALVTLAAISSRYMQLQQQQDYGTSLARLVAARVSTALETGDLLSVSASLQRFMETSSAEAIALTDVEGKALGHAGKALGQNIYQYSAPVHIESDIAGQVVITISADNARAAQQRFILSMLGLAVLLSLAVYGVTRRHFGQRLGSSLSGMARKIAMEDQAADPSPGTRWHCSPARSAPCPWTCCAPAAKPGHRTKTIAPPQYFICTSPAW